MQLIEKTFGFHHLLGENVNGDTKQQGIGKYKSCSAKTGAGPQTNLHRNDYHYFRDSFEINEDPVKTWISESAVKVFCDETVRIFDDRFAI